MHHDPNDAIGRRRGLTAIALAALGGAMGLAGWHAGSAPAAAASAEDGAWCGAHCGDVVTGWSLAAYRAIHDDSGYADPLAASRLLAMMHIAMHDAVNAVAPRFETFGLRHRDAGADPTVAAAAAAHGVLLALLPGQKTSLDAELARTTAEAGRGPAVARGQALGALAARAILQAREGDGAVARLDYAPGDRPGAYRFTPGFDFIAAPHWRSLRPFALTSPAQFRVAPPPALDSVGYRRAFTEVKVMGAKDSTRRSADETDYAHFWYEFSDIGWNRIARVVSRDAGLNQWAAARLFALVNMAMADGYIAGWDSKLHHDFWRPVTAIRAAASDGNAATTGDPGWEPLLPTPPIQDHPSTHSALGAAAAEVLSGLLGDTTTFAFASSSALPTNPVRRFSGFREAARENADSRVMAGLHFRFACDAGLTLGARIGQHALAHHLRPLEEYHPT